jgi:hypothetical protein
MAEKLKAAAGSVERLLLPRLNSIDGELKAINTRITERDAWHAEKIDSVEKVLRAEFRSLDTKVDEMGRRLSSKLDDMDGKARHRPKDEDNRGQAQGSRKEKLDAPGFSFITS